jgi:hypothetical protein
VQTLTISIPLIVKLRQYQGLTATRRSEGRITHRSGSRISSNIPHTAAFHLYPASTGSPSVRWDLTTPLRRTPYERRGLLLVRRIAKSSASEFLHHAARAHTRQVVH